MKILHLALDADWSAALAAGTYRVSTRGATLDDVGFIHCSLADQVARVAAFIYADVTEPLVLLTIDTDTAHGAGVEVRFEDGGNGELFPHIYGAIDPSWVVETTPAKMTDGALAVG
jgi:uncharacterized protein (DUF952 family)